jgi:hypothetical protein
VPRLFKPKITRAFLSPFYPTQATLNSTPFQSTKNNAVILSPFYARYQRQATAKIPSGQKKGEGSSRAFTQSKKPSALKNRLFIGISFLLAKGITSGLG